MGYTAHLIPWKRKKSFRRHVQDSRSLHRLVITISTQFTYNNGGYGYGYDQAAQDRTIVVDRVQVSGGASISYLTDGGQTSIIAWILYCTWLILLS
jgi:hypothetical protein